MSVRSDAELSRSELADVVWPAAQALQQRDREILELQVRAGLEARDLADALGVTPGHAAVLLSRMRERMEKASHDRPNLRRRSAPKTTARTAWRAAPSWCSRRAPSGPGR
jgi:DNA-directed RNA polymerase specialized sigma24 family protein